MVYAHRAALKSGTVHEARVAGACSESCGPANYHHVIFNVGRPARSEQIAQLLKRWGQRHTAQMKVVRGAWDIVKEASRHVLRRPVVGVALAATTTDERWVLVRRSDTGQWALPGGTVEWGETVRGAARRELTQETGSEGRVVGSTARRVFRSCA